VGKLDSLLGGGWAVGKTNVIYGPASSLKTTICIAKSLLFTSRGGIVFYLDTEGKTYPERLRGAVYRESREINTLLNHLAEIASRMRYLNPLPRTGRCGQPLSTTPRTLPIKPGIRKGETLIPKPLHKKHNVHGGYSPPNVMAAKGELHRGEPRTSDSSKNVQAWT